MSRESRPITTSETPRLEGPASDIDWWASPADGGIASLWRTGMLPVPTELSSTSDIASGNRYNSHVSVL